MNIRNFTLLFINESYGVSLGIGLILGHTVKKKKKF